MIRRPSGACFILYPAPDLLLVRRIRFAEGLVHGFLLDRDDPFVEQQEAQQRRDERAEAAQDKRCAQHGQKIRQIERVARECKWSAGDQRRWRAERVG